MLFGIYMVVNGLERFFIEKIRVNTKYILFGQEITQAELISLAMIISGLAIVYRLYIQAKKGVLAPMAIHQRRLKTIHFNLKKIGIVLYLYLFNYLDTILSFH